MHEQYCQRQFDKGRRRFAVSRIIKDNVWRHRSSRHLNQYYKAVYKLFEFNIYKPSIDKEINIILLARTHGLYYGKMSEE